jgi:hypothetical protein
VWDDGASVTFWIASYPSRMTIPSDSSSIVDVEPEKPTGPQQLAFRTGCLAPASPLAALVSALQQVAARARPWLRHPAAAAAALSPRPTARLARSRFVLRREDCVHRLSMDRLDDAIRIGREEAAELQILGAIPHPPHAAPLGPQPAKKNGGQISSSANQKLR